MIVTTATFSLSKAREYLGRAWPVLHPYADMRRAWVGFDSGPGSSDASPLRRIFDGPSHVAVCADWDRESLTRGHVELRCDLEPTIEHARAIVAHVLALHSAPEPYALAVHCHAGLFRSGAVAEWVRVDLGVEEHACSNRLVDVIDGGQWKGDRTFNETLLRMLREAHAEVSR